MDELLETDSADSAKRTLRSWLKTVFNLSFWLVIPYFSLAIDFLVRRLDPFHRGLSPLQFGLIAMAVFVSAYPIFVWKRNTPVYPYLGKLSFRKWLLLALLAGVMGIVSAFLSKMLITYFS